MNASQPSCNGGCDQDVINDVLEANSTLVGQLLECFLIDPNCTLFQSVLTKQLAKNHLFERRQILTHVTPVPMHVMYMYMYICTMANCINRYAACFTHPHAGCTLKLDYCTILFQESFHSVATSPSTL